MKLDTLRSRLARSPAPVLEESAESRAAVAAVLRESPSSGAVELLFIRRAEHPHDPWSGHMAWPGGRHEPSDEDLLHTAQRETQEELGLDLRLHGALLTRLDDLPAIARGERMGLVIAPFVFALEQPTAVLQASDEVAEALWIPLETLAGGVGRGTLEYVYKGSALQLPCIRYEGHVIWGLTFQMLEMLLGNLG